MPFGGGCDFGGDGFGVADLSYHGVAEKCTAHTDGHDGLEEPGVALITEEFIRLPGVGPHLFVQFETFPVSEYILTKCFAVAAIGGPGVTAEDFASFGRIEDNADVEACAECVEDGLDIFLEEDFESASGHVVLCGHRCRKANAYRICAYSQTWGNRLP